MTKLNRSDLAAIYRACDLIDKDIFDFIPESLEAKLYSFYGTDWCPWSWDAENRQNERIMALLFFATIMQEGGL